MGRIKRTDIVGQRIVEYLPSHDYATIVLDNGRELEIGVDEDSPVSGPRHPPVLRNIYSLERKLSRVIGDKNEKLQGKYESQISELKKSLVGKRFNFCGESCLVTKVILDKETDTDCLIIQQGDRKRKIDLYSLEQ
ncbi:MAG: hypothetical protein PHH54_00395 [Candidatus Nanoarchaeia archaeon]|nr:hypothetical protein [Candidatus Nanoarchaeia archaeon]MDD5740422.1 hypothetical protein [Candidatus Nanoarchaeia archaeon]